jgi:DNA-binding TFAR19-related protein (PDSD5 family)
VSKEYITTSGNKLGTWLSSQRSRKDRLTQEQVQRLDALGLVWDPHAEQWEQGMKELSTYKEEHGDCLVPRGHKTTSGHKLGSWVSNQRGRIDRLTPEQVQRLDALGFVWDTLAEQWEQGFKELSIYKEEHGDCLPSAKHITASGHKLGIWISAQRSKVDKLTPERIQRLDALGFVWDVLVEQWEQGMKELSTYKEEHGDCLVPQGYITTSGNKLGTWLSSQRSRKDRLTPEQVQRLDALEFVWDQLAEQWEQGFKELSTYKEEHGDCLVPRGHKTASGHKLGSWVGTQRSKKNQLTPEQVQRLDALGFVWDPHAEKWEQGIKELSIYKEEHADCLVSHKHITASGHKLVIWVSAQRSKKNKLTPEQVQRLDALGFVWDVLAEQWEQGIKELSTYKEDHGNCLVSQKYITDSDYKLGNWVGNQRSKKDRLTPEQIQRLDALGFVWDVSAEQWEQRFKELNNYKEEHGDCLVLGWHITASDYKLGNWVDNQRSRKEQLTPKRIQRLDALGFVWRVR